MDKDAISKIFLPDKLERLKGYKTRFSTREGEWEGVIGVLWPRKNMVTIEKVFSITDNNSFGTIHFFLNEITSLSVIGRSDCTKNPNIPSTSTISSSEHVILDDASESECETSEKVYYEDILDRKFVLKLPDQFRGKLPINSLILSDIDEEYEQSVQYISHQSVIGVSFQGSDIIDRYGELNWICISTPCCVYIFNIKSLTDKCFEFGLRNIFQDSKIEKVMHNSRDIADCLFHQFKTYLTNVFDTQVADLLINIQKTGSNGDHVNDLDMCLFYYLDIPEEYLFHKKERYTHQTHVDDDFRNFLIKNGIYLELLKNKLFKLMNSPFERAVEIYLNVLKNASEEELLLNISPSNEIPSALYLENLRFIHYKEFVDIPPVVSSGPPYRELKGFVPMLFRMIKQDDFHSAKSSDSVNIEEGISDIKTDSVKSRELNLMQSEEMGCNALARNNSRPTDFEITEKDYPVSWKIELQEAPKIKSDKIDWSVLNTDSDSDQSSVCIKENIRFVPAGMESSI